MEEHNRVIGTIKVTTDVPENPVKNYFMKPEEIGCYSLDKHCKLVKDDSTAMKKYYLERPLKGKLDLNEGFDDNFEIPTFPKDKIDNVLDWIKKEEFKPLKSKKGKQVDFVCSRGAIVKLLCTPYSKSSWKIHASKFKKTVYFSSVDIEKEDLNNEKSLWQKQKENKLKRKCYYGLKFEQFMTTDEPEGEPNLTQRCDERGMFCAVVKNQIGEHTLLFRAEMDAVRPNATESSKISEYVELKTCDKDVHDYYIYKSLSWWAQSIVTGIKEIICGIMDKDGVIKDIRKYKTQELPENQKQYRCSVNKCERKFKEAGSLKTHVEDHLTVAESGERKMRRLFQCIIYQCWEKFQDLSELRKHVREDHLKEEEIEGKKEKNWSPHVCIHFLDEVLNWMKSNLVDDPKKLYELNFYGGEEIEVSEGQLIGDWYVQEFYKAMPNTSVQREDSAGPSTRESRTRRRRSQRKSPYKK